MRGACGGNRLTDHFATARVMRTGPAAIGPGLADAVSQQGAIPDITESRARKERNERAVPDRHHPTGGAQCY